MRLTRRGFRYQMVAMVGVLLVIPVIVLLYDIFFLEKSEDVLLISSEKKLSGIADSLAAQVREKAAETEDANAESTSRILERSFLEVAVPMSKSYDGVRLCMYIVENDKILIQGYIHEYKERRPEETAEREKRIRSEAAAGIKAVVSGGTPITRVGKTWDDNFLECLVPIHDGSKIVAVVWAEERIHPAFARSQRVRTAVIYIIAFLFIAAIVGTLLSVSDVARRVEQIKKALQEMEKGFSQTLPPMPGDMGQIARAINKMAQGLEEKKQLEERLKRSEGLAALGRLVADIAHELRNPICVIQATTELIAEEIKKNNVPGMEDHISIINDQLKRHDKLTSDLLDFSRSDGYKVESLSLNDIIKEVIQYIGPLIQKSGIELEHHEDLSIKSFQGHREKLHQVFINIIMNSIQAMPGGGKLHTRTYQPDDGSVCVSIQDTGKGIEKKDLPLIFEPFYTCKEDGTGLGLAISQEIIKIHRGSMDIDSQTGKGTTIKVCFPVC